MLAEVIVEQAIITPAAQPDTPSWFTRRWQSLKDATDNRIAAATLSATMLLGTAACQNNHDTTPAPKAPTGSSAAHGLSAKPSATPTPEAPPLDLSSYNAVQDLVSSPQNPDIASDAVWKGENRLHTEHPGWNYERAYQEYLYEARQHQAEQLDLTVFNPSEVLAAMSDSVTGVKPLTSRQYLTLTNEFLANYGVQVSVDKNVPANVFNNRNTRQWLRNAVLSFAAVPKEYVTPLGMQQIEFQALPPASKDNPWVVQAYIKLGGAHDDIVVNLLAGGTPSVIWHEMQHGWDDLESGGWRAMGNDPTFVSTDQGAPFGQMSPTDTRPVAITKGFLTIDQFVTARNAISDDFFAHNFGNPGCMEAAGVDQQKILALGAITIFVNNYSAQKLIEQKAVIGGYVPDMDNWYIVTNSWTPHIEQQFDILLTRLYGQSPALARFFIEMARRDENFGSQLNYFQTMCAKSGAPVNLRLN